MLDGVDDLVKRHYHMLKVLVKDTQGQVSTRQLAGNGDFHSSYLVDAPRLSGNDYRPVVVADAGAVRQKSIKVCHMRIGVKRYGRHIVNTLLGGLVERLYVFESVFELQPIGL